VIGDGLNLTNFILASVVSPGTATGLLMVNDNTNGTVTTISGPLEFDSSPVNGNDFVGPISSGYLNVTGPITNTATGVVGSRNGFVRFSGGGNYTAFDVNQGTISLGANNGLCTNAALTLAASAAATFDLNGFSQILTGLADGAANAELITNSAASLSTLTLTLASGSTYSGVIAGNVALVENGLGNNLNLAGTNAYTGNTTVNSGSLELGQPTLAASSTVKIASGATLQLDFSVTNTVAALVLNGVSQPLGVYNSTTTPAYITGSGSLQVAVTGPGVFTNPTGITGISLSGANIVLNATNGQAGDAYYLLATTNLTLPRKQWTAVATNVLTGNGTYTFIGTNVITPGVKQQFYILSNTNN
jgi:autotransporter-associated beta strand protein